MMLKEQHHLQSLSAPDLDPDLLPSSSISVGEETAEMLGVQLDFEESV